jgi:site-specific recombinase XerC
MIPSSSSFTASISDHSFSELIGLSCDDIVLGTGAHVRCMGKGRKERSTPIR